MIKIGMIIDGVWRIEKLDYQKNGHRYYIVKNIYNNIEISIVDSTIRQIIRKKTQVSRIYRRRFHSGQLARATDNRTG